MWRERGKKEEEAEEKHSPHDGIYKLWQALLYLHPGCLAVSQLFPFFFLVFALCFLTALSVCLSLLLGG